MTSEHASWVFLHYIHTLITVLVVTGFSTVSWIRPGVQLGRYRHMKVLKLYFSVKYPVIQTFNGFVMFSQFKPN